MNYVTYGGVTVGLCLLGYELTLWWPGLNSLKKDPIRQASRLLPFLLSWAYGCLTTRHRRTHRHRVQLHPRPVQLAW